MIAIVLFPFSLIYRFAIWIWDIRWSHGRKVKLPVMIISVGGLTAGGSGKTSVAGFIASKLIAKGLKPAVVTRGYKRPKTSDEESAGWEQIGDEAAALEKSIPGLRIFVDSDKTQAASRAARAGCDPVIIDDGFQHRKLARDIDIVCLDGNKPFGNGMMIPSGRLREPVSALKRADIIIVVDPHSTPRIGSTRIPADIPVFEARKVSLGLKTLGDQPARKQGVRCLAFCGLGNPHSFRGSLENEGFEIAEFIEFRDHHIYSTNDLDRILGRFQGVKADLIITTLKDAVKLEKLWKFSEPLYYLDVNIQINKEEEFFRHLGYV